MIEAPEREEPAFVGDERTMLDGWLEYHRQTLAFKCSGLSADQLRQRAVPPSNLSLVGLLRHMTEVERGWFARVTSAEDAKPTYFTDDNPDGDFDDIDQQDADEAFRAWETECDRSRRIQTGIASLDQIVTHRRKTGEELTFSFRWIVTHMIEEYARHNGHADLLREVIDGQKGS